MMERESFSRASTPGTLRRPGKRASTGESRHFDREVSVADDDVEVAGFLPALADRQLDQLVDHALQEPGAVGEAVTRRYDLLERLFVDVEPLARALQRRLDLGQVVPRDLSNFVVRE